MMVSWNSVTEQARKIRKNEKILQKDLAALAGVSLPTVIKFEQGDISISLKNTLAILEVLGLELTLDKK